MSKSALEFVVFCIESIARRLGVDGSSVYDALVSDGNILLNYIVSNYEALRTQDKDYIVDDILRVASLEGVAL